MLPILAGLRAYARTGAGVIGPARSGGSPASRPAASGGAPAGLLRSS